MAAQKAQDAETAKLAQQQQAAEKQIGAVSNDVASVKTDVGGVKTDVATTRSDLETTKSQLQRVVGDAGVMSGLIATNHAELEELKHKGDRNYFEFTLQKGAQAHPALHHQAAAEEGGRQALALHPRRLRRRSQHREEGQEPR